MRITTVKVTRGTEVRNSRCRPGPAPSQALQGRSSTRTDSLGSAGRFHAGGGHTQAHPIVVWPPNRSGPRGQAPEPAYIRFWRPSYGVLRRWDRRHLVGHSLSFWDTIDDNAEGGRAEVTDATCDQLPLQILLAANLTNGAYQDRTGDALLAKPSRGVRQRLRAPISPLKHPYPVCERRSAPGECVTGIATTRSRRCTPAPVEGLASGTRFGTVGSTYGARKCSGSLRFCSSR
jgi:hypothetical protein